jgi:hypothetical protein
VVKRGTLLDVVRLQSLAQYFNRFHHFIPAESQGIKIGVEGRLLARESSVPRTVPGEASIRYGQHMLL